MPLLRKNTTQLHGTNFCTSSAHFASSFVRQPNGSECTQMLRNAPKRQFSVKLGGSGSFVAKNSNATSCTNFSTSSARFAPSFVRQKIFPNAPKWYETHQNISLGCNGLDHVHSLQKIPTRLHGTNFCTSSVRFAPSFVREPNSPECTQIVQNAPKC